MNDNEPHPMSVKVCGECDGQGAIRCGNNRVQVCPACKGSRKYGYLSNGDRVAYDVRRSAWVRT